MTSYATQDERPYTGYSYRAPGSSHGGPAPSLHTNSSPDRQGYIKGNQPPESPYLNHEPAPPTHTYPPQPPITPISGSSYPPQPPASSGGEYYGPTETPGEGQIPSPPPTSAGRPGSENFTPDGLPLVPVGVSGGKMFKCRGYGECDKVFTRSEHLARHVRKHTGERPFPCHCGKAFSRLDNLRQHSATVHSDQTGLNEAMLNSLGPVHAALSQRANREQRKRGEIVEVPKNAVERPRHNENRVKGSPGSNGAAETSPYQQYAQEDGEWGAPPPPHRSRTSTGGNPEYPYAPPEGGYNHTPGESSGPSRRPGSSEYQFTPLQAPFYPEGHNRAATAPGTGSSSESGAQLPYPYRPISSDGRELPVPQHYTESEPPNSARGPPQSSPMYPPHIPAPQGNWSSPPSHSAYPPHEHSQYPTPGGEYAYPQDPNYGPPPPSSAGGNYQYSSSGFYPPQTGYSTLPSPVSVYPPPAPFNAQPPPSPFESFATTPHVQDSYPYAPFDQRKRRAEEPHSHSDDSSRKHPRPSTAASTLNEARHNNGNVTGNGNNNNDDTLWLPPTTERRSSLAISALLGSPQQTPRSRPGTGVGLEIHQHQAYGVASYPPVPYPSVSVSLVGEGDKQVGTGTGTNMPPTPGSGGSSGRVKGKGEMEESMGQKAKALLGESR